MKIRVTAIERPNSFNIEGQMDYMLNHACELEVTGETNTAYIVKCLHTATRTWHVNKSFAEVVEEPTYKFPKNLRKGDDIDWNTINPEVAVMYLFQWSVPSLFKYVQNAWYVQGYANGDWDTCDAPSVEAQVGEIVFRGERQSVAVKTGWYFNPNADDPRILYVFRKDADSWLLAGWPVTHAYMSEHYNVSKLIPMEEWLKLYKNKD